MSTTRLAVLASTGPFGPTAETCLLLPVLLVGPFVLLALTLRSVLMAEPLSRRTVVLMVVGAAVLSYFYWPLDMNRGRPGFWTAWRVAAVAVTVMVVIMFVREAAKHRRYRR